MNIIIGSDHRGLKLRDAVVQILTEASCRIEMCGPANGDPSDYPDIAKEVALKVCVGEAEYGILICGLGIGMCLVANKFPGVRAAPCHNVVSAELSRRHNNANILCLSGDMLGEDACKEIIEKWLTTEFDGGRHQTRLDKIKHLESQRYLLFQ